MQVKRGRGNGLARPLENVALSGQNVGDIGVVEAQGSLPAASVATAYEDVVVVERDAAFRSSRAEIAEFLAEGRLRRATVPHL